MALNLKLVPLRFGGLPIHRLPSPLAPFQSVDLVAHAEVANWLKEMVTALPPHEDNIQRTARQISTYFKRLEGAFANTFVPEAKLHPIEYRLGLIARLSDIQRGLFYHVLTWQGKDGVLESDIRKGYWVPYHRHTAEQRAKLSASSSEYYFRLRELYHLGLLTMEKIDPTENKWKVRPEIAKAVPPCT